MEFCLLQQETFFGLTIRRSVDDVCLERQAVVVVCIAFACVRWLLLMAIAKGFGRSLS